MDVRREATGDEAYDAAQGAADRLASVLTAAFQRHAVATWAQGEVASTGPVVSLRMSEADACRLIDVLATANA